MREFKFRAWSTISDGFIEPIIINGLTGRMIDSNAILMQYTGLKDKNGVEIYEGDITNNGTVEWFDNLSWDSGGSVHPGFYFRPNYKTDEPEDLQYHTGFDDCEVIGNIYENPELLK